MMTSLKRLEAGKTYIFKDEEVKVKYLYETKETDCGKLYNDGFTLDKIDGKGNGILNGIIVIFEHEMNLFKEKKMNIKPEDEVTIATTYGELARAYAVLGKVNGKDYGSALWSKIATMLDPSEEVYSKIIDNKTFGQLSDYNSIQSGWLDLLFPQEPMETSQQKQIRELREQAELLLSKAKELEGTSND